jgi:hypothetical protein
LEPFTDNDKYSFNGSIYYQSFPPKRVAASNGYGMYYYHITASTLIIYYGVYDTRHGKMTGTAWSYQTFWSGTQPSLASLRVSWYCKTNTATELPSFFYGPPSEENLGRTVSAIFDYFGYAENLFSQPKSLGALNLWSSVLASESANVSIKNTISKLTMKSSSGVHLYWKYDDVPYRFPEWRSVAEFGVIPGRIRNAASLALADAMSALPEVSANSIQNVLELASGVKGVAKSLSRGFSSMLQDLSRGLKSSADPRNAWLSWRYVYNTTKMDINDYKEVTSRLLNMNQGLTFKVHGVGQGDGFSIRCVRQYRNSDFDITSYDTRRMLETYGFKLSAYNMWDMVPFSFMVDWFTHVGPKLELAENWNRHYDFVPTDVWYSYHEQLQHGYIYYRWHWVDPTIPPTYVNKTTSKRTLTYRLADTISIFS